MISILSSATLALACACVRLCWLTNMRGRHGRPTGGHLGTGMCRRRVIAPLHCWLCILCNPLGAPALAIEHERSPRFLARNSRHRGGMAGWPVPAVWFEGLKPIKWHVYRTPPQRSLYPWANHVQYGTAIGAPQNVRLLSYVVRLFSRQATALSISPVIQH